jgi:hypothetical protein
MSFEWPLNFGTLHRKASIFISEASPPPSSLAHEPIITGHAWSSLEAAVPLTSASFHVVPPGHKLTHLAATISVVYESPTIGVSHLM